MVAVQRLGYRFGNGAREGWGLQWTSRGGAPRERRRRACALSKKAARTPSRHGLNCWTSPREARTHDGRDRSYDCRVALRSTCDARHTHSWFSDHTHTHKRTAQRPPSGVPHGCGRVVRVCAHGRAFDAAALLDLGRALGDEHAAEARVELGVGADGRVVDVQLRKLLRLARVVGVQRAHAVVGRACPALRPSAPTATRARPIVGVVVCALNGVEGFFQ